MHISQCSNRLQQLAGARVKIENFLHLKEQGRFIGCIFFVSRGSRLSGGLRRGVKPSVIDEAFTNPFMLYRPGDRNKNYADKLGCYGMHKYTMDNTPNVRRGC
jgi:hypothetical protein